MRPRDPSSLSAWGACGGLVGMEYSRFLECLASDFARLRSVVTIDPAAEVPTCPGWSVA